MLALLLLLFPFLSGIVCFLLDDKKVKMFSLISAVFITGFFFSMCDASEASLVFSTEWMHAFGSSFSLALSDVSSLFCLLTVISFPFVFFTANQQTHLKASTFYGLLFLTYTGLLGVFMATDALLFYFFWELVLIPVYFLCSRWGGEQRIAATFKFFVYTFAGSVLMLIAIVYVQSHTTDSSFSLLSFQQNNLSVGEQSFIFFLWLAAFAVKLPLLPFHTWQPDTYDQSPNSVTMVLSALMVKMGLFGVIQWMLPVVPLALPSQVEVVAILCVVGVVYASITAIRQDNVRKMIAYISIAHISVMTLALFSGSRLAIHGALFQLFNHGINVMGLWLLVGFIEQRFGTKKVSDLGGMAKHAPMLTLSFVIILLANVALPLTNAFVGEFMMLTGLYNAAMPHAPLYAIVAASGVVLSAVYGLTVTKNIFFGAEKTTLSDKQDIRGAELVPFVLLILFIFVLGVYPNVLLDMTQSIADTLSAKLKF